MSNTGFSMLQSISSNRLVRSHSERSVTDAITVVSLRRICLFCATFFLSSLSRLGFRNICQYPSHGYQYQILLGVVGNYFVLHRHRPFNGVVQAGWHFFIIAIVFVPSTAKAGHVPVTLFERPGSAVRSTYFTYRYSPVGCWQKYRDGY
jgi:hypothetical protein